MSKHELVEAAREIRELDAQIEDQKAALKALRESREELVERLLTQCESATQKTLFDDEEDTE